MKDKSSKDLKVNCMPPRNVFTIIHSNECLKLDKTKLNFCKYPIFASSFKQITLNTELMDYFTEAQKKDFHLLKIKAIANPIPNNQKFAVQKLFTIKAVQNGEQVNDLQIPIKAGESIQIFVRTNIPELDVSTDINGTLTIQVDDFPAINLPIMSRGQVPQIVCLKEMESVKTGSKIIKIPSKGIMKIPFKNCSNINFFFEVKLIAKDVEAPDIDGVKINVIPTMIQGPNGQQIKPFQDQKNKNKDIVIKVDANSAFCITLALQLLKKDTQMRVARRLLVLQVQGTKLLFPFPLQVIISE